MGIPYQYISFVLLFFSSDSQAKKEMAEGTISEKEFATVNDSCKKLIKEASLCLRDEPVGTMEKVLMIVITEIKSS